MSNPFNPLSIEEQFYHLSQIKRDVHDLLMEEALKQLEVAERIAQEESGTVAIWSAQERDRKRALLVALILTHTALEDWASRSLQDEHRLSPGQVNKLHFVPRWEKLGELKRKKEIQPAGELWHALKQLNELRNHFIHYKAEAVEVFSDDDPYSMLEQVPTLVEKLRVLIPWYDRGQSFWSDAGST